MCVCATADKATETAAAALTVAVYPTLALPTHTLTQSIDSRLEKTAATASVLK